MGRNKARRLAPVIGMVLISWVVLLSSCTSTPEEKKETVQPQEEKTVSVAENTTGKEEVKTIPEEESSSKPSQGTTEVARITIDELLQLTENDANIVIVDVRSEIDYHLSHIKGAVSVPESVIAAGEWEPPDAELFILY